MASTAFAVNEFYAAMTRAREGLYLLNHPSEPADQHARTKVKPSIFLSEIKENVLWKIDKNKVLVKEQELLRMEVEKRFEEGESATFREGIKVHHKIFGPEIVIRRMLSFVTILFNGNDKKFFFETIRY